MQSVCCVVALGFGVIMIALTFVAAELGGVLQVGDRHLSPFTCN